MKTASALSTALGALENAREALKPAICDLASNDELLYDFELLMRTYLSLRATSTRMERTFNRISKGY